MSDSTPPITVLIAEDEEPIAIALSFIVEDAGFRPIIAAHGRQALELARQYRPALIITDYMMPLMNGIELINALRHEGLAQTVILMSAAGTQSLTKADADMVIAKPFEVDDIEAMLHRYLG